MIDDSDVCGCRHIFYADERVLRIDHEESNHAACAEHLYSKLPKSSIGKIHTISIDPATSLLFEEYAQLSQSLQTTKSETEIATLKEELEKKRPEVLENLELVSSDYFDQIRDEFAKKDAVFYPVFDLILLGIGPDGHTCSLFPGGHKLLFEQTPEAGWEGVSEEAYREIAEKQWVGHVVDSPKPPPARVTLTFAVLNHAARVAYVATDSGKAEKLREILDEPEKGAPEKEGDVDLRLPAAKVKPVYPGQVWWFVDDAASAKVRYGKSEFKL